MGGSNSVLGSVLNGIGTDRAAGGDPLKGALINASILASSGGMNPSGLNPGTQIGQAGVSSVPSAVQQGTQSIFDKGINFVKANPDTSLSIAKTAGNLIYPENNQPVNVAPISYGNNGNMQYVDFSSLLNPNKDVVIKPQNFSLLG